MSYDSNEALKLDSQLCFPLYAASRKIIGAYTPLLKPLGITYTQYIVFMVLWEQDGITVGDLGSRLRLDSGTLTPVLKKMEAMGYLIRERSQKDERIVNIHLTDKGRDRNFLSVCVIRRKRQEISPLKWEHAYPLKVRKQKNSKGCYIKF